MPRGCVLNDSFVLFLVFLLDLRVGEIVMQYFFVVVSFLRHHGGTDLAETYTVSPASAGQCKLLRYSFVVFFSCIHYKGGAVEVRGGERTSYLQFLADGHHLFCADDFQPDDASRRAPFRGSRSIISP